MLETLRSEKEVTARKYQDAALIIKEKTNIETALMNENVSLKQKLSEI
jgi:hypothetical protein